MMSVLELFGTLVYVIMYLLSETEQHVRASLRDAILLLCQTGLKFNTELSVDGLLAVTLDKKHVFLLSIKETLQASERCSTNDDSPCLCTNGNQAVLNFSSVSPSEGSDEQIMLIGSEQECTRDVASLRSSTEMSSQCVGSALQLDSESLVKADQMPRRRQRKQRRTVRRFLDTPCPTASSSATSVELELLEQPDLVLRWTSRENGDMPVCSNGEHESGYCASACVTQLLSNESDHQATVVPSVDSNDQSFVNSGGQECDEADSSLRLEDRKLCDNETPINPTLPEKELVADPDCERSLCQQRCMVQQYVDCNSCPVTTSLTRSLESLCQTEHISGSVDNENGEAPILNDIKKDRCKMELSDNLSDSTQTECQDLTAGFHLSSDIKAEVHEPAASSTDISELESLGRNIRPSSDPQQQMAMMSQFGLSAVASMQSHFALLPKPFPWSVRTFPSLSAPSLPAVQCGMVGIITLAMVIIHTILAYSIHCVLCLIIVAL